MKKVKYLNDSNDNWMTVILTENQLQEQLVLSRYPISRCDTYRDAIRIAILVFLSGYSFLIFAHFFYEAWQCNIIDALVGGLLINSLD